MSDVFRVSYTEFFDTLVRVLRKLGFEPERAELCARLFAETTRDGIYSHGLNRFPRLVATIRNGSVDVAARPELVAAFGALERWDGKRGPGNLNAHQCMERAIALARQYGMGCVALANTNHWMRGGSYGWQAAEAGCIGICWTNTLANVPAWGGTTPQVGNNPLVFAVPRPGGHVVLDMAMSQFSYGALASYRERGELLPVDGGFDTEGNLTRDPAAIEASQRALPIGYWKGSGLSLMLDMVAAMLSGGLATYQIPLDPLRETQLSQVFLALNPAILGSADEQARIASGIIESLKASGGTVRYPGEKTLKIRQENTQLGIPVDPKVWQEVLAM
ncbi:MAG: 3-dehydro-L-gulonate 2-dehydrogenase [Acidobacteriaceae bacterium]